MDLTFVRAKNMKGFPRTNMEWERDMILFHITTKRSAEGVGKCQQEKSGGGLLDGRGDVIVCHQELLWEIPSDESSPKDPEKHPMSKKVSLKHIYQC